MKKRFKLVMSVASLAMAIFVTMLGVYAAGVRSISVTGTVSFQSQLVAAEIAVAKTAAYSGTAGTFNAASGSPVSINAGDQVFDANIALGDTALSDVNNKFSYRVSITNNQPEDSVIYVVIIAPTVPSGTSGYISTTAAYATGTVVAGFAGPGVEYSIANGATFTATFEFVITVASAPSTISASSLGDSTFTLYTQEQ